MNRRKQNRWTRPALRSYRAFSRTVVVCFVSNGLSNGSVRALSLQYYLHFYSVTTKYSSTTTALVLQCSGMVALPIRPRYRPCLFVCLFVRLLVGKYRPRLQVMNTNIFTCYRKDYGLPYCTADPAVVCFDREGKIVRRTACLQYLSVSFRRGGYSGMLPCAWFNSVWPQ